MNFKKYLQFYAKNPQNLKESTEHGLERETLRVNKNGEISLSPHNHEKWGSPLTNKYISTDFAEPMLELITPIFKTEAEAVKFLRDIHVFIVKNLKDELLWPSSMPPKLPKDKYIPLANYGTSNEAIKKTIYRHGLGIRYGRKMQTISGIHYNFSFSDSFWFKLHKEEKSTKNLQDFITDKYFHIMRNFLRYGWLITYLYGATPALDKSFLDNTRPKTLNKCGKNACYSQYATSLRMSDFGYNSKIQTQLAVSFNNLDQYLEDITFGISTSHKPYTKLGIEKGGQKLQLNDHILQNENEYYSPIRPKQPPKKGETVIGALKNRGIKYLEIRGVDINPDEPAGVSVETMKFIKILLTYCLFMPSPDISKPEKCGHMMNFNQVAMYGRNPELKIKVDNKETNMMAFASKLLTEMRKIAGIYGHEDLLEEQILKTKDPSLTPSSKVVKDLLNNGECFLGMNIKRAFEYKKELQSGKINKKFIEKMESEAAASLHKQKYLEAHDEFYLEGHEDMEYSTQILIKEAKNRGIEVEILDRSENFLRLKKGRKTEYIKQATITRLDSAISYFIQGNKFVHKQILHENGIRVPMGKQYTSAENAINDYSTYGNKKLVIKPTNSNYGIGIGFATNEKDYSLAVHEAFKHDNTIIVEEFISGEEYRFLVLDGKTFSVLNRLPANVIGDGVSTISRLIEMKNADPNAFKPDKYQIRKGNEEKDFLKKQKLTFSSVPKKGKRIFLRPNSNVSTGGDPLEVSELIHPSYKIIAEKAAQSVDSRICGLDMLILNPSKKADPHNYGIIEVNYNPAIQMHEFPEKGQKKKVAQRVLDILGF